jgi:hypothetical protein
MMVGVIALIELLLLSKWYKLPYFVFCSCVFALFHSFVRVYFIIGFCDIEYVRKWMKNLIWAE